MTTATGTTLERFVERLGDFGVSHTRTPVDGVADAVAAAIDEPAVGVPLPEGLGELPATVDTDWSPATLRGAATGVTEAALGIADYGSLVLPTTPEGVEPVSLFAERHVAVVDERDIVPGIPGALTQLGDRFRDGESVIVATGPSATADMGSLVKGAHGPETVHAIIVER